MPNLEEITVAWICPLAVEGQAALLMLDEFYDEIPQRKHGQSLQYIMGRMCDQDIVIVRFPEGEVGIGVSGSVIGEMTQYLPSLELVFLVGLGAGLPSESKKRDIRLGDVAVAVPGDDHSGIIHYTLQKIMDGGETKVKGFTNATSKVLRSAVGRIRTTGGFSQGSFLDHLNDLQDNPKAKSFFRPGDIRPSPSYSLPSERDSGNDPVVHYGTILSGDSVVKSKELRDSLRDKHDAICIEMEAGGLMNTWPAVVIRGISDFGDSSKNDEWHKYGSVTAAAYAKEVLRIVGPVKREG